MILAGNLAGEQHIERFRAECRAIAQLKHPNVVQVYEVGEHDGLPYFSLEYCPGGRPERLAGKEPLPPERAAGSRRPAPPTGPPRVRAAPPPPPRVPPRGGPPPRPEARQRMAQPPTADEAS